jgi:hypothetical protein
MESPPKSPYKFEEEERGKERLDKEEEGKKTVGAFGK